MLLPPLLDFLRRSSCCRPFSSFLFLFTDPATTEIYTLSLHDALPILLAQPEPGLPVAAAVVEHPLGDRAFVEEQVQVAEQDRKSTRLNSSHVEISYAVFCLKKKSKDQHRHLHRRGTARIRQVGQSLPV